MVDALLSGRAGADDPDRPGRWSRPRCPPRRCARPGGGWTPTSCTIVPLRARGETFGALALMNCGDRPPHTEMEIATAVEVARRGALALDNARLYGRQLKVAETLQRSLLTPPPQPDHLQIAVRYRPAASHQQVGGDWYDAFQQPDGATAAGHRRRRRAQRRRRRGDGADPQHPARHRLRPAGEPGADPRPRRRGARPGCGVGTLATALSPASSSPRPGGRRAAHAALVLGRAPAAAAAARRRRGAACSTARRERLLGTGVHRPRAATTRSCCAPGDTVVFYTDGLVEHGRTGIDEGIARLAAELGELADAAARGPLRRAARPDRDRPRRRRHRHPRAALHAGATR